MKIVACYHFKLFDMLDSLTLDSCFRLPESCVSVQIFWIDGHLQDIAVFLESPVHFQVDNPSVIDLALKIIELV